MKKEGPIFIRFTMEQITLRFERKTLKDMKGDFTKELLTTDHIENAFNMTRGNIKNHFEGSKKNKTDAVKVKYYREIFDLEICCDCIIDLMGTLQLTESMKEWDPFPFNDNGERYSRYKKERFNTPSGIAKDVSDDFVLNLLKSDAEDEKSKSPKTKTKSKGEPGRPSGKSQKTIQRYNWIRDKYHFLKNKRSGSTYQEFADLIYSELREKTPPFFDKPYKKSQIKKVLKNKLWAEE